MKKRTRVTHLPDVTVPPDDRPLVAPIYQSVKFSFDDVAETQKLWMRQREGFYYSRVSNPTLRQLERVDVKGKMVLCELPADLGERGALKAALYRMGAAGAMVLPWKTTVPASRG